MDVENGILVRKIKMGTVIDHIPPGRAFIVLRLLGLHQEPRNRLAVIVNTDSRKLGRKDIIKVEGIHIKGETLNKIGLVAPDATVNYVEEYRVVEKFKVRLPDEVIGVVKCSNPRCISNSPREHITPRLEVVRPSPLRLRCIYCERYTDYEDVIKHFFET